MYLGQKKSYRGARRVASSRAPVIMKAELGERVYSHCESGGRGMKTRGVG